MEAFQHQPRPDEKHDSQRDLGGNEHPPRSAQSTGRCAVAATGLDRLTRIDPVAQAEPFDALRRRQRVSGMIATTLAFIGLVSAALYR